MNVHEAYEFLVDDAQLIDVISNADRAEDVYAADINAAAQMNLDVVRIDVEMIADTMFNMFWGGAYD